MIYEVVDSQTISLGVNDDVERTTLAVKVQFLDEGIDHTKVFEFDASITDEAIKVEIENYGRSLKNNEIKTRKVELEGSIL